MNNTRDVKMPKLYNCSLIRLYRFFASRSNEGIIDRLHNFSDVVMIDDVVIGLNQSDILYATVCIWCPNGNCGTAETRLIRKIIDDLIDESPGIHFDAVREEFLKLVQSVLKIPLTKTYGKQINNIPF